MLLLASCGGPEKLAYLMPAEACWKADEGLVLDIDHSGEALGLTTRCELTQDYPFSNLYLEAKITNAEGLDSTWTQTVTFVDRLGTWQVPKLGSAYLLEHPLCETVKIPAGKYTLRIRHFMRPQQICGVRSVMLTPYTAKP